MAGIMNSMIRTVVVGPFTIILSLVVLGKDKTAFCGGEESNYSTDLIIFTVFFRHQINFHSHTTLFTMMPVFEAAQVL